MRLRTALMLFTAASALPALAAAQPVVTSPAPDALEVTIYRDPGRGPDRAMNLRWLNGFALVSERRRVRLPAGESVVRFEGVAGGIVPQSAIVTGFPDGVLERNRDAYLLSPATLLDRSLGRRVHLRRTSRATGEVREQEAVVRSSAAGAVVIETEEGIEALRCTGLPESIVYDEVPPGLSAKPTLSVRTRASAPIDAIVTLSYLATGFDWQANYVAQLSDDGRTMDLFAWLTLGSQDETSFPNADTQAVAGRLNYTRAQVPPAEGGPLQLRCWPHSTTSDIPLDEMEEEEGIIVTGSRAARAAPVVMMAPPSPPPPPPAPVVAMEAQQEELGDLKLYRIPEPVTVAANSQKQVALLTQEDVAVRLVYRARVGGEREFFPTRRVLVTRNRTQEGLGVALPAGRLVLFRERQGQPFLAAQGRLDDRAVGEDVEIELGSSPGVQFRVERVASAERWTDYLITATSDQLMPVQFEAEIPTRANSRLVGPQLGERDGMRLWSATIPANGTIALRYRVESTRPR